MAIEWRMMSGMGDFGRLPDELVLHILSSLSLKDAVRTSILSSRWRYLYASISSLETDFGGNRLNPIRIVDIIDRFFYFRDKRCPLDKFCLRGFYSRNLDPLPIQRWIQAAIWHGIHKLMLTIPPTVQLPSSLCTCKTLEVLKVFEEACSDCESKPRPSLEVPAKVCLPNLKVLVLEAFMFSDDDSLNRLISNCPVLEECKLFINDCKLNISSPTLKTLFIEHMCLESWSGSFEISIDAPNVNYLGYFVWGVTSHTFENLKSLDSAVIDFPHISGDRSHYIGVATALMKVMNNLQTFRITGPTLTDINKFSVPIPVFQHVTRLTIYSCEFSLRALLHFLEHSVSLETLVFVEQITCNLDGWNPLEESRVICFSSRLKTIEICSFEGKEDEMEMIKFLLRSAKCIERMEITDKRFKQKYENSERLFMFPRASKECVVVLG